MKTTTLITASLALALVSCGDDQGKPDAPHSVDAPSPDALNIPTPPNVGTQIDRMGRPAINTALDHLLDTNVTTKAAARDMYNGDQNVSNWPVAWSPELSKNLAIFDALDKGLSAPTTGLAVAGVCSTTTTTACTSDAQCPTGQHCKGPWHCSTTTTTRCGRDTDCPTGQTCVGQACGNQLDYAGMLAGQRGIPSQCFMGTTYQPSCSYASLAAVLADDQLYLDTTKPRCNAYLAIEFAALIGMASSNTDCGGRAPANDVMDSTYSLLTAGVAGFAASGSNPDPSMPQFGDGVGPHADLTTTFPYFGPPH
jgi:hypothetical protein